MKETFGFCQGLFLSWHPKEETLLLWAVSIGGCQDKFRRGNNSNAEITPPDCSVSDLKNAFMYVCCAATSKQGTITWEPLENVNCLLEGLCLLQRIWHERVELQNSVLLSLVFEPSLQGDPLQPTGCCCHDIAVSSMPTECPEGDTYYSKWG